MMWNMHKLVFSLSAFAALFASAEMQSEVMEVVGYGVGDTFEEAVVVAKSDAVQNASGRVTSQVTIERDKLNSMTGMSSNMVDMIEFTVIEKGDSFAGVSARIKAVVSKHGNFRLKDGSTEITGTGRGKDDFEAYCTALGELVLNSGCSIRAVSQYEEDDLVKDESIACGQGYVDNVQCDPPSKADGMVVLRMRAPVSSKPPSEVSNLKLTGSGGGRDRASALKWAWVKALVHCPGTISACHRYDSGRLIEHSLDITGPGVLFEEEEFISESAGHFSAQVKAHAEPDFRRIGPEVRSVTTTGFGFSKNAAVDAAKRHAVDLVFGRKVKGHASFAENKPVRVDLSVFSCPDGYVDDFKVSRKEEVSGGYEVQIQANVRQRGFEKEHGVFWWIWHWIVVVACFIWEIVCWIFVTLWQIICWIFAMLWQFICWICGLFA